MPPIPKQLLVMKRLAEHLEAINPTNEDPAYTLVGEAPQNYAMDLRQKVFRGKTVLGTEVLMPALAILESPQPVAGLEAGEQGHAQLNDWRVLVQGFATDDKQNPTDPAYILKAAVELRLGRIIHETRGIATYPEEYMLGGLIAGLSIGFGPARPPEQNVSQNAFFYIPLVIKLATTTKNPYVSAT
jgi:hypothetical protein